MDEATKRQYEAEKQYGQHILQQARAKQKKRLTLVGPVLADPPVKSETPVTPEKPLEKALIAGRYPTQWLESQAPNKVSQNEADLLYPCPTCHEVPGVIQRGQWYRRRLCACEKAAYERKSLQRYEQDKREAHLAVPKKDWATYTWLGYDYSALAQRSLHNFEADLQPEGYGMTVEYLMRMVRQEKPFSNLLFYGEPGRGKTHLATALLNSCYERGYSCLFTLAKDYFDALYAADFPGKLKLRQRAGRADFFLIDDVDKALVKDPEGSAHQKGEFFQLLNIRYEAERPTFFTANSIQLKRWFDEWTVSRVQERLVKVPVSGEDYRELRAQRLRTQEEAKRETLA
jgi:DNA replication protein DnaC